MFKCMTLTCFSTVSVWRLSTGLPSRPGLLSGGKFLHNPSQHDARYPWDMRVCRGTVWLRSVWYDPLLPSLRLAKERLVYVQPEGLPRQTPLWAPEIRWAMESRYSCFHQLILICSIPLQKGQWKKNFFCASFDKHFMHLVGVVLALRGMDEEREAVSSIAPMEYFLSVCSHKIYALTQCPS